MTKHLATAPVHGRADERGLQAGQVTSPAGAEVSFVFRGFLWGFPPGLHPGFSWRPLDGLIGRIIAQRFDRRLDDVPCMSA